MVAAAPIKSQPVTAKGIELFPVGRHVDSQGRERSWTAEELQEMADAYNSVAGSQHDAPILVGHDGNTAYGWLERCYVQDEILLGDYKEVSSEFAEGVNAGRHKKRSISIYPRNHPNNPTPGKLNVRHVAYVGVPAVKGMADHMFNDSGEGFETYEFAERLSFRNPIEAVAYLVETMRERSIAKDGLESANESFPKEVVEALRSAGNGDFTTTEQFFRFSDEITTQLRQCGMQISELTQRLHDLKPMSYAEERIPDMTTQTSPDSPEAPETPDLAAQFAELQTQMTELQGQFIQTQASLTESRSQVAALQAENAQLAQERERDRVTNFVESLVQQRKLIPSEKQAKIELALAMPNEATVDFTEGTGTVSLTPRQRYLNELAAGKELWSSSDMPTHPQDAPSEFADPINGREESFDVTSVRLDRQIRAKARELGKDPENAADYAEAMQALNITI